MYKYLTKLLLIIVLCFAGQLAVAEEIETVIIEGMITFSSLPDFMEGEYLVWEISLDNSYIEEETCDIYSCSILEKLAGPGNESYGFARSDGEVSSFEFDDLSFVFNNALPENYGEGSYYEGDNYMRFQIIGREGI